MNVVYILFSHDARLLPTQINLVRKYMDASRVVVVQGPVGDDNKLCWGKVRLTDDDAQRLQVDIVEADSTLVGYPWLVRRTLLYDQLIPTIRQQPEQYAWILEADVIPMKSISSSQIMGKNKIAGRFSGNWTWFCFQSQYVQNPIDCTEYKRFEAYGCKIEHWPPEIIQPKDYQDKDHFEWCEPGFLHLDRITLGLQQKKLDMFEEILGHKLGEPACQTIPDDELPHVKRKPSLKLKRHMPTKHNLKDNIVSYEQELDKWEKAGKPVRSPERMKEIFDTHCFHCPYYTGEKCNICGCLINLTTGLNKLRWATTYCPHDPPKWTADIPINNDAEEKAVIQPEKESGETPKKQDVPPRDEPPIKKKRKKGCGCR